MRDKMLFIRKIKKDLIKIPRLVKKPEGSRVLVLAPHFDDETLGCGGTILKHIKSKDKVSIIHVTDSARGITGESELKTHEIRKLEAKKALKILGVEKFYHLKEKDGEPRINYKSVEILKRILNEEKPDTIYVPNFLENHTDHLKTNHLLKKSFEKISANPKVCAYEVWTPIPFPNIIVDISNEIELKKKAIKCFKSQLKEVDYLNTIIGLNKYRAIYNLKGKAYAEAFLMLPIKEYLKRIK